jgi:hypothetical protein
MDRCVLAAARNDGAERGFFSFFLSFQDGVKSIAMPVLADGIVWESQRHPEVDGRQPEKLGKFTGCGLIKIRCLIHGKTTCC